MYTPILRFSSQYQPGFASVARKKNYHLDDVSDGDDMPGLNDMDDASGDTEMPGLDNQEDAGDRDMTGLDDKIDND